MDIKLNTIPAHDFRIIVVPGQLLQQPLSDYKTISDKAGDVYTIHDSIIHLKGEFLSGMLKLLSTGIYFNIDTIYNKYSNSNRLIFFICKKKP